MTWICKLFRKKKPKQTLRIALDISDDEWDLMQKINNYRFINNKENFKSDFYLLGLAKTRTGYLIEKSETVHLHYKFLGHRQHYLTKFNKIAELALYGYINQLDALKNSKEHNKTLLMDWKYIAVSIEGRYTCVILGK